MKPLEYHGTNQPYTALDVILKKQEAMGFTASVAAQTPKDDEPLVCLAENAQGISEGVYGIAAQFLP